MKKEHFAWLENVDEHEWKFDFSMDKWQSDEDLDIAIEKMYSKPEMAKEIFVSLVAAYPYHFDAYHHLALILGYEGKYKEALNLRKIGVENGFSLFPKNFDMNKDKLEWGWLENRPFLRLLHGLAIDYSSTLNDSKKELEIYEQLMKFDPDDHQGCRCNAVDCYLELNLTDKILELGKRYKGTIDPEILYGKVLAYLIMNSTTNAKESLMKAIKELPKVAEQITDKDHKKPKISKEMEGYVSVGGKDQAYYYWKEYGKYWEGTDGAIELVNECLKRQKR